MQHLYYFAGYDIHCVDFTGEDFAIHYILEIELLA